jgi:prolyl oligopeptidase
VPEFGSVDDPAMFEVLHAYSPYHRVEDGARLSRRAPRGGRERPPRRAVADPEDGGAAPGGDELRPTRAPATNAAAGHGMSNALSHQIEEFTDILTFLFRELD